MSRENGVGHGQAYSNALNPESRAIAEPATAVASDSHGPNRRCARLIFALNTTYLAVGHGQSIRTVPGHQVAPLRPQPHLAMVFAGRRALRYINPKPEREDLARPQPQPARTSKICIRRHLSRHGSDAVGARGRLVNAPHTRRADDGSSPVRSNSRRLQP
eukprot:scaffold219005_cov32-Tisochrysis_lutea.AAC.6